MVHQVAPQPEQHRVAERHDGSVHADIETIRVEHAELYQRVLRLENILDNLIIHGLDQAQFTHLSQIYAAASHSH